MFLGLSTLYASTNIDLNVHCLLHLYVDVLCAESR